jgi:SpoVK/Ycf46/Vps4 family AAA+-type ATPase
MSMQYLVDKGVEYAHKAVAADKSGDYETAIKYYKVAIEFFSKYLKLYPDAAMSDWYRELIEKYKERINILSKAVDRMQKVGGEVKYSESDDIEVLTPEKRGNKKKFDDLVDLEEVKRALRRAVIYPVRTPELYPLGWPKGILLFGPPGCGKTEISLALANEINAVLINVSPATIMSKWLGDAEKNVKKVFDKAREIASNGTPVIIFIDEVDGLLQVYGNEIGGESRMRNQFLQEMDGLKEKENNRLPLFIIGATNKPWNLDIGFIRRFEKRIYVPQPNKEIRKQLFMHYVSKLKEVYPVENIDYDKLAEITEYYTPADISSIIKEVQNNIAEEINETLMSKSENKSKPERVITTEDIIKVIQTRKPSIDPNWLESYREWMERYGAL